MCKSDQIDEIKTHERWEGEEKEEEEGGGGGGREGRKARSEQQLKAKWQSVRKKKKKVIDEGSSHNPMYVPFTLPPVVHHCTMLRAIEQLTTMYLVLCMRTQLSVERATEACAMHECLAVTRPQSIVRVPSPSNHPHASKSRERYMSVSTGDEHTFVVVAMEVNVQTPDPFERRAEQYRTGDKVFRAIG